MTMVMFQKVKFLFKPNTIFSKEPTYSHCSPGKKSGRRKRGGLLST
jgi:hypothetical protein